MTSPIDTKAARARCDAATPGPWHRGVDWVTSRVGESALYVCDTTEYERRGEGTSERALYDADFIAHARTDLPAALDEVERLRDEVEQLRAALREVDADLARGGYPETSAIRVVDGKVITVDVRGLIAKALKGGA